MVVSEVLCTYYTTNTYSSAHDQLASLRIHRVCLNSRRLIVWSTKKISFVGCDTLCLKGDTSLGNLSLLIVIQGLDFCCWFSGTPALF